jgi:putative transposase
MPWQETNPMLERRHFIHDFKSGHWAMNELCLRYGVSRVTGYKWVERYQQGGDAWLVDQSRAPRSSPNETAPELVRLILEENGRYGWGARKVRKRLLRRHPDKVWPARSTISDILLRNGRVRSRRRRTRWKHPGAAPFSTTAPNQVWTVDFKGQFRMRDGRYCYPLTVVDHFSRYLLCCHGLLDIRTAGVLAQFRRLFHQHGLPDAIRSDNGAPFASTGIHGLTHLNVWWLQLGITHQRITPGQPQQNAAHERMHRSLKQRLPRPSAANLNLQQRVFNAFRRTYNHIRPHEALGDETPASRWKS